MADPTRIVADADVLAADLLVGGAAREALDLLRSHGWLELVVSGPLLDDLEAVVAHLADPTLATDHRQTVESIARVVDHHEGDHPGLAAAHAGGAAHLLSLDPRLTTARTGLTLQPRIDLSVRTPEAFVTVFDAASLYEAVHDDPYPGPDGDPRA